MSRHWPFGMAVALATRPERPVSNPASQVRAVTGRMRSEPGLSGRTRDVLTR